MKNLELLVFALLILVSSCEEANNKTISKEYPNSISHTKTCERSVYNIYTIPELNEDLILSNVNLECLIKELKKDQLAPCYSMDSIPFFLIEFVSMQSNDGFWLANPNEKWQSGCIPPIEFDTLTNEQVLENGIITVPIKIIDKNYPTKQLIEARIGKNTAFIFYAKGNGFLGVSSQIIFFQFEKETVVDFWCWNPSPYDILDNKDIIKEVEKLYEQGKLNRGESISL